jgi:hypothetical protein
MMKKLNLNDYWLNLAKDVIFFAKENKAKEDYIRACRMKPRDRTQNLNDRIKIFDHLVKSNVVGISGDSLFIKDKNYEFLDIHLKSGNPIAWEIASLGKINSIIRKFDCSSNVEIGNRGEDLVLMQFKLNLDENMHSLIDHVSTRNDTLGYDIISPSTKNNEISFIEVKTSVRNTKKPQFFISRNEYEVSRKKTNWFLVLVKIINDESKIFGHIHSSDIQGLMPVDTDESKWQSAHITLELSVIKPGLP